jgi:glycosyltransferase involved in cell wall biosynthesis
MKILVVNWQDIRHPQSGGAEVHLHEVFSRIAAMGHEVTLLCSHFPGAPREEVIGGITIIRKGGRLLFNFRFLFAYCTRFRMRNYDIVVDDMNKIPFFSPLFVGKPLYGITHHLFGRSIFLEANPLVAFYVYCMELLAVRVYRLARTPFIVGSPSTQRELLERGFPPERVSLIQYGVDHCAYRQTGIARSATPLIGYFGRLKKYKSVDHLLRALPPVLARYPDLHVTIVGEGDDRTRLEALTRDLQLVQAVTFRGFVSEEDKLNILQQMWFKVTTSSKEGWGLTVIEANACGTPVLASNVQGLRDAVKDGETGVLYTFGDVDDLSSKIITLLADRPLREKLSTNALAWAATFDWDIAARRTCELLQRRLGRDSIAG